MAAFTFDGKEVAFEPGDTVGHALHRAGIRAIARSMKYHRPRGLYCMAGSCGSCLVAVDGVPNLPACTTAAATARDVRSQNTLGGPKRDLLAVTDKVFRHGFDPHGAFTKPRILNKAFLRAVRMMSGVGTAPETNRDGPKKRHTRHVRRLIVGAGTAGRAVATDDALLIDEDPSARTPRGEVWAGALAFGIYDKTVGIVRGDDLWEVTADEICLATGHNDGVPLFAGNDLPGIFSERGAQLLSRQDVLPGTRLVLHGPVADAAWMEDVEIVQRGAVEAARGRHSVEAARIDGRWNACDAIVCAVPRTPRIELAQQAGCALEVRHGAFVPVCDANGVTSRPDIRWCGP